MKWKWSTKTSRLCCVKEPWELVPWWSIIVDTLCNRQEWFLIAALFSMVFMEKSSFSLRSCWFRSLAHMAMQTVLDQILLEDFDGHTLNLISYHG